MRKSKVRVDSIELDWVTLRVPRNMKISILVTWGLVPAPFPLAPCGHPAPAPLSPFPWQIPH